MPQVCFQDYHLALRKHAYSNILKISPPKTENYQINKTPINSKHRLWVLVSEAVLTNTHNLCFLSGNKENNVYPCKPQFYYIKEEFKEVKIT